MSLRYIPFAAWYSYMILHAGDCEIKVVKARLIEANFAMMLYRDKSEGLVSKFGDFDDFAWMTDRNDFLPGSTSIFVMHVKRENPEGYSAIFAST